MVKVANERELVSKFRIAKEAMAKAEEAAKKAKKEYEKVQLQLVEAMMAQGQKATAKYDGIGYVLLMKPRLYASYEKENEEEVFAFVREQERADLIRPSIHSMSLSSFIAELIEQGKPLPKVGNGKASKDADPLFRYTTKPQTRLLT